MCIRDSSDTELLIIDSAFYAQLIEKNVYVEAFTYRQTAERFSEVMWVMEQVLFMSFDERLAVFLLDEVARTGSSTLTLTQDVYKRQDKRCHFIGRYLNRRSTSFHLSLIHI